DDCLAREGIHTAQGESSRPDLCQRERTSGVLEHSAEGAGSVITAGLERNRPCACIIDDARTTQAIDRFVEASQIKGPGDTKSALSDSVRDYLGCTQLERPGTNGRIAAVGVRPRQHPSSGARFRERRRSAAAIYNLALKCIVGSAGTLQRERFRTDTARSKI